MSSIHPNDDERVQEQLRSLILPNRFTEENFVFIVPAFIDHFDYKAAALLSRLVFLSDKGHDPDGYVYKTYKDLKEELHLTRDEVDYAVKKLRKAGVLHLETRKPRNPDGTIKSHRLVRHYLVDLEAVALLVGAVTLDQGSTVRKIRTVNQDSTVRETRNVRCGEPATSYTERLTERTYRYSSFRGARSRFHGTWRARNE